MYVQDCASRQTIHFEIFQLLLLLLLFCTSIQCITFLWLASNTSSTVGIVLICLFHYSFFLLNTFITVLYPDRFRMLSMLIQLFPLLSIILCKFFIWIIQMFYLVITSVIIFVVIITRPPFTDVTEIFIFKAFWRLWLSQQPFFFH